MNRAQVVAIAKICHEANRAYCQSLGDFSQQPWELAPDWQRDSVIKGVVFHLEADRKPSETHESWMKEKLAAGWKVGAKKDPEARTHPCLVPYDQLPEEQRVKDRIFTGICKAFKGAQA